MVMCKMAELHARVAWVFCEAQLTYDVSAIMRNDADLYSRNGCACSKAENEGLPSSPRRYKYKE